VIWHGNSNHAIHTTSPPSPPLTPPLLSTTHPPSAPYAPPQIHTTLHPTTLHPTTLHPTNQLAKPSPSGLWVSEFVNLSTFKRRDGDGKPGVEGCAKKKKKKKKKGGGGCKVCATLTRAGEGILRWRIQNRPMVGFLEKSVHLLVRDFWESWQGGQRSGKGGGKVFVGRSFFFGMGWENLAGKGGVGFFFGGVLTKRLLNYPKRDHYLINAVTNDLSFYNFKRHETHF